MLKWKSLSRVWLFVTPWIAACQASLSMEFSRQEEWVAIPFSRGSSQLRIEPRTPALQADSLPSELPGKPQNTGLDSLSLLQGIFPTQGSNWGLLHCRRILYQPSYRGSPWNCLCKWTVFSHNLYTPFHVLWIISRLLLLLLQLNKCNVSSFWVWWILSCALWKFLDLFLWNIFHLWLVESSEWGPWLRRADSLQSSIWALQLAQYETGGRSVQWPRA